MSIQANFPAIKPTLLLDFANTEALDPRITFTRASTGTYYDGKTVAKAEENLLPFSQTFQDWSVNLASITTNSDTAPDGTTTADTLTAAAANGEVVQAVAFNGSTYTMSVWIKRKTGTGNVVLRFSGGFQSAALAVDGTWQRFSYTVTPSAGTYFPTIRLATSGDEVYIWGAQLEQRSFATAYTPTTTAPITNYIPVLQTAAAGTPRFDHNPVTGESLGLEIEEQRTNLVIYSEDFIQGAWLTNIGTVTVNTNVGPNGTTTADTLTGSRYQSLGLASATYTFSCYAKKLSGDNRFSIRIDVPASSTSVFDLNLGTVVSSSAGLSNTITPVGNDWYRCSTTITGAIFNVVIFSANSGSSSTYVWGAQLEAGAFPTSYIPTVASQVTRAADSASITGSNFSSWYNAGEGTVYSEFLRDSASVTTRGVWSINSGVTNNSIDYRPNGGNCSVTVLGTNVVDIYPGGGTVGLTAKNAFAFKVNDFAASTNAGTVQTDTSGSLPIVSQMQIGGLSTSAGQLLGGTIKKLAYYPARLTNTQLQALTT